MKKILLIGAGVIGLVVLVGAVLLYANRDKISSYAMDRALTKIEPQVLQHLSNAQDAATAKAEFATLHARLQSGDVRADEIKELAAMFYASYRDEQLDSTEVRQLVNQVHAILQRK
jgi:methionine salvage enolase-phosphatase E1